MAATSARPLPSQLSRGRHGRWLLVALFVVALHEKRGFNPRRTMAVHFTTWRALYQFLEAERRTLLTESDNLKTACVSSASFVKSQALLEPERSARLQRRGGVVDEVCSAFAHTRRWPAMSRSLAPLLLDRLVAARDLAEYISQPDRAEPNEPLEIDCELTLRWALIEYWHMGGLWRPRYAEATLSEHINAAPGTRVVHEAMDEKRELIA